MVQTAVGADVGQSFGIATGGKLKRLPVLGLGRLAGGYRHSGLEHPVGVGRYLPLGARSP